MVGCAPQMALFHGLNSTLHGSIQITGICSGSHDTFKVMLIGKGLQNVVHSSGFVVQV